MQTLGVFIAEKLPRLHAHLQVWEEFLIEGLLRHVILCSEGGRRHGDHSYCKAPRNFLHLVTPPQATMCDISIIATDWYLCLFSTSLPAETVARVWDALFNEGPKILYRVALALLKVEEETLLKFDNAGMLEAEHNVGKSNDESWQGRIVIFLVSSLPNSGTLPWPPWCMYR